MLACSNGTKIDLLRANLRLQVRYLEERYLMAALLQFLCEREKGIYVTGDGWADDAEVSQLPEDPSGGCGQTFALRYLCWTLLPAR